METTTPSEYTTPAPSESAPKTPSPQSRLHIIGQLFVLGAIFILTSGVIEFSGRKGTESRISTLEQRGKASAALIRLRNDVPSPLFAEGVFVARVKTGEVLFEKNADSTFATASLAKLMTALLLFEDIHPLGLVPISQEAKAVLQTDEKQSRITGGTALKEEDLLKLVVAESDNDAAYAAAELVATRREPKLLDATFSERIRAFVSEMNEKKESLGMDKSSFANPAGIDMAGNYATPRDLGRLAVAITRGATQIWGVSRTIEGDIYLATGETYHFVNTNELLREFPSLWGSKTGFTDDAGGALILMYELASGDPIVTVIMKSQDRFQDGRVILRWLDKTFTVQP